MACFSLVYTLSGAKLLKNFHICKPFVTFPLFRTILYIKMIDLYRLFI